MKRWDKGSKTEDHGKVFFASFFFFGPSYIIHALRKESTIKRSVDDVELFDDHHLKRARII